MKKQLLMILLATGLVFTGCGSDEPKEEVEGGTQQKEPAEEDKKEPASSGSITKEKLMAMDPTSEEYFEGGDNGEGGYIIDGYNGESDVIVIPETIDGLPVHILGSGTFMNDKPVKAVRFPDSMHTIEEAAFTNNPNIEVVVLGSGLKKVGDSAFLNCEKLQKFELPDGLEVLEAYSLSSDGFDEVEIPSTVTEIEAPLSIGTIIIAEPGSPAALHAQESSNYEYKEKK